jgi:hypothetical protein
MNVRLHIDRVVLDGIEVAAGDRPRLQAALETELTRLVAEAYGTPASSPAEQGASRSRLSSGAEETAAGRRPLSRRDAGVPLFATGAALPSVRAPQISIAPGSNAKQIGTAIAGAVFGGVGGKS